MAKIPKPKMTKNDKATLLVCSFRYALGRRTYITGVIADLLIKHHDELNQHDIDLIVEDIEFAISRDMAGMECDIHEWLKVVDFFRNIGAING